MTSQNSEKIERKVLEIAMLLADVQSRQRQDGSIASDRRTVDPILQNFAVAAAGLYQSCGRADLANAFVADFTAWQQKGWGEPPNFDRVEETFSAPKDGELSVFVGPVIATNGPTPTGHFFECFAAVRDEPVELETWMARWPHPLNKCQSMRLRAASTGFARGNCIVFFPENIKTQSPVSRQRYALFFFNKFAKIYQYITYPIVRKFFGNRDTMFGGGEWLSFTLDAETCYKARCMWGYLHDYFHHVGPRPLHLNLRAKLNWFAGLLEEIKVDCQAALAGLGCGDLHGKAVFQFVVFERMLRYPSQPDCERNFDSGTGVFLFEWLRHAGAIARKGDRLTIDHPAVEAAMTDLILRIEEVEQLLSDAEYKVAAKHLVRQFLPEHDAGARFRIPEHYAEWFPMARNEASLEFEYQKY